MTDLTFTINIEGVSKEVASSGFMTAMPMPTIEDPNDPTKRIDAFPSVKARVEYALAEYALKVMNIGIGMEARATRTKLTMDIFAQGD